MHEWIRGAQSYLRTVKNNSRRPTLVNLVAITLLALYWHRQHQAITDIDSTHSRHMETLFTFTFRLQTLNNDKLFCENMCII